MGTATSLLTFPTRMPCTRPHGQADGVASSEGVWAYQRSFVSCKGHRPLVLQPVPDLTISTTDTLLLESAALLELVYEPKLLIKLARALPSQSSVPVIDCGSSKPLTHRHGTCHPPSDSAITVHGSGARIPQRNEPAACQGQGRFLYSPGIPPLYGYGLTASEQASGHRWVQAHPKRASIRSSGMVKCTHVLKPIESLTPA